MKKKYSKKEKESLGLGQKISRKDFLKGTMLGSGMMLLNMPAPGLGRKTFGRIQGEDWDGYQGIGDYSTSNGNTWEVITEAHRIRDNAVSSQKPELSEDYDMVIIGGGFTGLAAAYTFMKEAEPNQKCLIMDNHPIFGGEAKQNEFEVDGHRLVGPQGSNGFLPIKGNSGIGALWNDLNLPTEYSFAKWNKDYKIAKENYGGMYFTEEIASTGYYFHENDQWVVDPWKDGLKRTPWTAEFKAAMLSLKNNHQKPYTGDNWQKWLDGMTYKEFMVDHLKLPSSVSSWVDPFLAVSAYGLGSDVISAYGAYTLSMPGVNAYSGGNQYTGLDMYSFPGGNSGIARHFVKRIIPKAIDGGSSFEEIIENKVNFNELDKDSNSVRIRLNSTVVRVGHDGKPSSSEGVNITYSQGGKLFQIRAKAVVMACGGWVSRRVLQDIPTKISDAYSTFNHAPILSVNVALSNWRFLDKLGITAAHWFKGFGFYCNIRQPMMVGGKSAPLDPNKPIVLTFYKPFLAPGKSIKEQGTIGRNELFATSYSTFELQIREHLTQLFSKAGFNPKEDIKGIITNRWGHAFICPQPGFYFGMGETEAPRKVVEKGYGRIALAHSELDGHQNWLGAASHGIRAAKQLLNYL